MEPRYEYPYLPPVCRRGDCDHPEKGEGCTRYRYRTCREGTCTHASQGLACAYVEPPKPAPAPAPRRPFQHHDECESPDGGSCTCDLIAEYGDQYDRESH